MELKTMRSKIKNLQYISKVIFIFSSCSLLLEGCQQTKDALGISRDVPDEFAVVKHAPLEMPPDFTMRPPKPGVKRPQEKTVTEETKSLLLASKKTESTPITPGAQALLSQAGTHTRDPQIREVIATETPQPSSSDPSFMQKLAFWKKNKQPAGDVINPVEEKKRLKKGIADTAS
jgi:hypothetical protein